MCTVPLPVPMPGELLIRVAYIGVNRADLLQVEGKYDPPPGASPLPGLEVSGHVTAFGAAAADSGFTLGQPVCALLSGGGYAEYVTAPAAHMLPLPAGLTLREGASLPEAAATSIMALFGEGGLQTGERVLIHGGTSGVGILMTQIARAHGAQVFATVGNAQKADFLVNFGITPINHHIAPFPAQLLAATDNQGVNLIIDTLGGPQVEAHFRLLRAGGRLVTLAMLEGASLPADMKMTRLLMHHLRWSGVTLRSRSASQKAEYLRQTRESVWPKLANGTIKPFIDHVFCLSEAEKAHQRMRERLHLGKILLEVTPK